MGKRLGRLFIIVFGASLGIIILPYLWKISGLNRYEILKPNITNGIIGALIFLILSQLILNTTAIIMKQVEKDLQKFSPDFLLFGMIGTILGLVLGALICIPIYSIRIKELSTLLSILVLAFFAYVGFKLGTIRIEDWKKILSPKPKKSPGEGEILERNVDDHFRKYKILDTSVIIDGRIYDILKEGFIEGVILIPNFVLYELQYIADSGDSLKRVRGRRGLDILNSLQKENGVAVEMYEGDFDDIEEVDSKLIKLAKLLDGIVVTNDFNLNKVCEFQNVPVLNINALANAVKPVVIPGETMSVKVVKEGKERQQGIAYLDDGTMIVVEDGQYYMNKDIIVIVTSALQTAAGRMIFAKPAHAHKGINTPSDQVSDVESSKKKSVHNNQKKK